MRVQRAPDVAKQHRVTSFPTLICLPAGASEATHRFEGKEPTFRRLETFVSKCALRKPVLKKPDLGAERSAGHSKEEL